MTENISHREHCGMYTGCKFPKEHKRQKECTFYEKATHANRCAHLRFRMMCTWIRKDTE